MIFKSLTQFLNNNQKEVIASVTALLVAIIGGVFLLLSVAMTKQAPAPVINNYDYRPTYYIEYAAPTAPFAAPEPKAPRPPKLPYKQRRKPVAKAIPRPSCTCEDSTKTRI